MHKQASVHESHSFIHSGPIPAVMTEMHHAAQTARNYSPMDTHEV